jgi:cyanophycinase-like exopeptidase
MSLLVVMGSGETAPTMVKVHREVLAASGDGPAVLLDTPFGFQLNADDLVTRTRAYFEQSVGTAVEVARWRRAGLPTVDREQALALVARAAWVFAGPGSPTYALRCWTDSPLPAALAEVAERGGTLVFGSAAACTLGTHTVPVYEIYKVGAEPAWVPGLDLLGRLTGLRAVVVPHYDNNEGGHYDTRFCYLGEPRLARLEGELPDEVGVLGVDEHTALVLDLRARTARVTGNGVVTLRRRGRSTTYPDGAVLAFDALDALLRGEAAPEGAAAGAAGAVDEGAAGAEAPDGAAVAVAARPGPPPSLRAEAEAARAAFDAALAGLDVDGCVGAVLELDGAIVSWGSDTDVDDADLARRTLRAMIVTLGDLARDGARDPRDVVGPFVTALVELRARAREHRDWATSDLLRDRLAAAGVEVRDTPEGPEWSLARDRA